MKTKKYFGILIFICVAGYCLDQWYEHVKSERQTRVMSKVSQLLDNIKQESLDLSIRYVGGSGSHHYSNGKTTDTWYADFKTESNSHEYEKIYAVAKKQILLDSEGYGNFDYTVFELDEDTVSIRMEYRFKP